MNLPMISLNKHSDITAYFNQLDQNTIDHFIELSDVYEDGRFTANHVHEYIKRCSPYSGYLTDITGNYKKLEEYCAEYKLDFETYLPLESLTDILKQLKAMELCYYTSSFLDYLFTVENECLDRSSNVNLSYRFSKEVVGHLVTLRITNSKGDGLPTEWDYMACLYLYENTQPTFSISKFLPFTGYREREDNSFYI